MRSCRTSLASMALMASVSACGDDLADDKHAGADDTGEADSTADARSDIDGSGTESDANAADATTDDLGGSDAVDPSDALADIEDEPIDRPDAPPNDGVFGVANGCFTIEAFDGRRTVRFAAVDGDATTFAFDAPDEASASRFLLRPADLGTYLLYDESGHYLVAVPAADSTPEMPTFAFARHAALESELTVRIDGYRSPGEWTLDVSERDPGRFQLLNVAAGRYLQLDGLVESVSDSAIVALLPAEGCAEFPELSVDAVGEVVPRQWDDGAVYGFVDAHSHIFTNTGFGGGGMFHGAPFHRLGVEHALPDCTSTHGEDGRADLIGYFYDGNASFSLDVLLPIINEARTPEFNHNTEGYPDFVDWPNARESSTHQTQYYRWLERAYRSGLRLVVELATGNEVLCDFITGLGAQDALYDCNEMVGVDRQLQAVRDLERYIDAQSGGPGQGWLRIVESPAEAREVINSGRLAIVLGIETSNLFDCLLTPRDGNPACTPESVISTLDEYHERGVRVVFPVHKYDNAFAAGDGSSGIIEVGNFINSGHYSNLVDDCPLGSAGFDSGEISFGGLNQPRDVYDSPAPANMRGFATNPLRALLPYVDEIQAPSTPGNFCQNAGLTPLGETLIAELMERGMIIDIAHLPQRGVVGALEMLEAAGYPASSTHGQSFGDRVFGIGGYVQSGFHGCASVSTPDTMGNPLRERAALLNGYGLYPGPGFAFDLNGFAGGRGPRFGDESGCPQPQPNPVTYPFTSYDGTVEFQQPTLGNREVDFNTEGMLHIGLVAELIEDVRRDGMSDEDLEPLFRSAEAWIRMWEAAEARAAEGI